MDGSYPIDEDVSRLFPGSNEMRGVILPLGLFETSLKVPFERLVSPWARGRVRDRSKRGSRSVLIGRRSKIESERPYTRPLGEHSM